MQSLRSTLKKVKKTVKSIKPKTRKENPDYLSVKMLVIAMLVLLLINSVSFFAYFWFPFGKASKYYLHPLWGEMRQSEAIVDLHLLRESAEKDLMNHICLLYSKHGVDPKVCQDN